MKAYFKYSIFGIISCLVLHSCSIEKRMYSRGYNIEWNKRALNATKNEGEKQGYLQDERSIQSVQTTHSIKMDKPSVVDTVEQTRDFVTQEVRFEQSDISKKQGLFPATIKKTMQARVSEIKEQQKLVSKKTNQKESSDGGGGGGALRAIGWILIIIGLLVLLLASILGGILIMLLGLIFVISGKKPSNKTKKEEDKTEYVDVVYLKNGSVIRGTIVEQIPNETIKIQTKDGSLFVYKLDEVLRMTKEPVK